MTLSDAIRHKKMEAAFQESTSRLLEMVCDEYRKKRWHRNSRFLLQVLICLDAICIVVSVCCLTIIIYMMYFV